MDFSPLTDLYDTDFTNTTQYEQLLIDFPLRTGPGKVWKRLSRGKSIEPGLTKALFLTCSVLRYVHTIMTQLFAAIVDSTGVVGQQELLILHILVNTTLFTSVIYRHTSSLIRANMYAWVRSTSNPTSHD